MKAEFDFDGERLRLYIRVEDRCEVAMAKLLEKYNRATISLDYGKRDYYTTYREEDPKGLQLELRESPKCPATGGACDFGCEMGATCTKVEQRRDAAEGSEKK